MAEYQEEVYIVERKEISDDGSDDQEFEKMLREANQDEQALESVGDMASESDEDDLNDFNALKSKTEKRQQKRTMAGTGAVTIAEATHTFTS